MKKYLQLKSLLLRCLSYIKGKVGPVVVVDDGEAADEFAHGLDGRGHVDHRRVLGDEAVVAVALRLEEEGLLLTGVEVWNERSKT